MYNINLNETEQIKLISDNTIIYNDNKPSIYTSIITNDRYLVLDYPSNISNPKEDLRILGKINYIKQKEVIFETSLTDIIDIKKEKDYHKIILTSDNYILINDIDIINYLKNN